MHVIPSNSEPVAANPSTPEEFNAELESLLADAKSDQQIREEHEDFILIELVRSVFKKEPIFSHGPGFESTPREAVAIIARQFCDGKLSTASVAWMKLCFYRFLTVKQKNGDALSLDHAFMLKRTREDGRPVKDPKVDHDVALAYARVMNEAGPLPPIDSAEYEALHERAERAAYKAAHPHEKGKLGKRSYQNRMSDSVRPILEASGYYVPPEKPAGRK